MSSPPLEAPPAKRRRIRTASITPPMNVAIPAHHEVPITSLPPEVIVEILRQRPQIAPTLARVGGAVFGRPAASGLTMLAQLRRQEATKFECAGNPNECVLSWPDDVYISGMHGDVEQAMSAIDDDEDGEEERWLAPVLWSEQEWNATAWNCPCLPLSFDLPLTLFDEQGGDVTLHFRTSSERHYRGWTRIKLHGIIMQYLRQAFTVEQKQYIVSEINAAWQNFLQLERNRKPGQRARTWSPGLARRPRPNSFDEAFMMWLQQSDFSRYVPISGLRSVAADFVQAEIPRRAAWGVNNFYVQPVQQWDRQRGQTWVSIVEYLERRWR